MERKLEMNGRRGVSKNVMELEINEVTSRGGIVTRAMFTDLIHKTIHELYGDYARGRRCLGSCKKIEGERP